MRISEEKRNESRKDHVYKTGDLVFIRNIKVNKLSENWSGPFTITTVLDVNRIKVQQDSKIVIRNVKSIRPYLSLRVRKDVVPSLHD